MVQFEAFVVTLFLCCVVISTPLEPLVAQRKFTLKEKAFNRTIPWSGAISMQRTALKYGAMVPAAIGEAAERDMMMPPGQTTTAARSIRADIQYLITARVGNHDLSLDLDTGSSDLWVVSTLLPENQRSNRAVTKLYDPKASNAKQLQGHSWQIKYGDQSRASGQVYLDKVTIGDLTVQNQAVEAASSMSTTFLRERGMDGLLGMGFSKLNTIKPNKQLTWFDNIRPKLAAPVFTASLKRHATGSYDFGYIDRSKYSGEIIWTPVNNQRGHWGFSVSGFAVGDGPVREAKFSAISDTGSSLWYMPKQVTDAYYAQVKGATYSQGQSAWVFPCSSSLPDISVVISGKRVTVPGINMNYRNAGQTCFGGLQRDLPMPFSVFGDVFMKGLYVVHEAPIGGQPRIGFAKGV